MNLSLITAKHIHLSSWSASHCGDSLAESAHYVTCLKTNGQCVYISDTSACRHATLLKDGYVHETKQSPYLTFYKHVVAVSAPSKGPIIHTDAFMLI